MSVPGRASSGTSSPSDVSDLELLAHYEVTDDAKGSSRSGFAVLLELTDRHLAIEGDVSFKPGDQLRINFFLPDSGSASGRTKISLRCTVSQCRDPNQLHYGARISGIAEAARNAIQKFHAERASRGQS